MSENRRTAMTKMLFRTALTELMQQKPFHKITIKELCEQADLNRTTFYLHYTDQQDLLNDVVMNVKENLKKHMKSHPDSGKENIALKDLLEYIRENAAIYKILMADGTTEDLRINLIGTLFQEMKDQWPFFDSAGNNEYIYTFMMDGCASVISKWIRNNYDYSAEELAKLILKMCHAIADKLKTNAR